jgi:AcrR family transcriptional regulator
VPKQVDHTERRGQIADAVGRLASRRGLQGVSFREVAAEAGMSVALVQHYFGTKENLLVGSLGVHTSRFGERLTARLAALADDTDPLTRLQVIATGFLPLDDDSRAALLLYHAFAAAALTDPALRNSGGFRDGEALIEVFAALLRAALDARQLADGVDPRIEAQALLSLVLGQSLTVLLDRQTPDDARTILVDHLDRLRRRRPEANTSQS